MDEINYQKLLITRICDLDLDVNEILAPHFNKLKKELKNKNILLWPDFYFGDEWGCVNKKISISIPFYCANEELKNLQGSNISYNGLIKIIRHEIGHAVNYAYKLWKKKEWKETFGDFNKKYPKKYIHRVNPWSKEYVRHLHYVSDPHYAQKHPDEDWAETFAVWLDPRSRWKTRYETWPVALQKLLCLDHLMEELAGEAPLNTKKKRHGNYKKIEDTVSEWWGLGEEIDTKLQEYLTDMKELFTKPADKRRKVLPANTLIRDYARQLTEQVNNWILSSNKNSIRQCLRQWENICKNESLGYLPEEENKKIIELSTLLTYHVLESAKRLK